MKALLLYTEVAGYTLACIQALIRDYGAEVLLVRWPIHPDAPFQIPELAGLTQYERPGLSPNQLMDLALGFQPDAVYIAGWVDKEYVAVGKALKSKGIPVVGGMDNQWVGSLRQKLAAVAARWKVHPIFSHLWVAGLFQYEFARRLGYSPDRILTGLYSADTAPFERVAAEKGEEETPPRELLYVGRFVDFKGVQDLCAAFVSLTPQERNGWKLHLVGNGPMKEELPSHPEIMIQGFVQPKELPSLAARAGAFVLPSRVEPWGVVLHEFAAAGLPILASTACGAATAFLRPGYNGFSHLPGNVPSLKRALVNLFSTSDSQRKVMGRRSLHLSRQISPESWAATFFQLTLPE